MHLPADARWTPVIGGALIIAAMVGSWIAWALGARGAGLVVVLLIGLAMVVIGFIWTLRDWSTPRRR